ncbi:phasin family protein [Sphingomonas sp. GlSt437]|uniref:phasin family protein n=1 Tax=Sphingomonas sp. GlSt437 TaxID=3389970 RepID=UPI003A8AA227
MATPKKPTSKVRETIQEKLVEPAKQAGERARASGAKLAESGPAIGSKIIDHAEANTREAFAAMRAATKAKDLTEVMKIQGDFLREQGARSMTQAREIGELILSIGKDAVGTLRGKE